MMKSTTINNAIKEVRELFNELNWHYGNILTKLDLILEI